MKRGRGSAKVVAFFAEAPRGLEFVAADEVMEMARDCGGIVAETAYVHSFEGAGLVEFGFELPAAREEAAVVYERVLGLRTTDDVYAQFACVPHSVPSGKEAGLPFFLVVAACADIQSLRTAYRVLRDVETLTKQGLPPREDGARPNLRDPVFRATCDRYILHMARKHEFNSIEVAGWAGSGLELRTHWKIGLTGFDVQQHVHCCDDAAWMGFALTRRAPKINMFKRHHTALCKTTMKASIAAAMCRLACRMSGAVERPLVVCDMMCGSGTIPLEASFVTGAPCILGADVATEYAEHALANLRACDKSSGCWHRVNVLNWDARCLPLRSNSVDLLLCDMPYGLRCGNSRKNGKMYGAIVSEVARVLVPGAHAWLLTIESTLVRKCLTDVPILKHIGSYTVDNSGLMVELFCIEKLHS